MPKLPKRFSSNAAPKLTGDALAEAMEERVRSYHKRGRENLSAADLMKNHGLSQSVAFKAKQFAKCYTANELKAFLKLRREKGLPLHWGHIQYLLLVPPDKKAIRVELQQKAAEHDWNPKELLAEIRRRIPGDRGSGGRPRKNGPGSKAFIPSLTAEINDIAVRVSQIHEKLRSGDLRVTQQRRSQLERLDQAAMVLGVNIQRARRAAAAINRA